MVRYGFIHTKEDIKFLVLFAMDLLPFPVSFSTIVDLRPGVTKALATSS